MRWYRTASSDLSPIASLPYVVVGGGAMGAHGLRESGGDTDLLMMSDVAEEAQEALRGAGWSIELTSGGFSATKGGQGIDVLTERGMALADVGAEGISEAIGTSSGHVLSKPWLLVTKILASRDKDLPDLSLLMAGMTTRDVARAKSIAKRYAPWIYDLIESEVEMAGVGVRWAPAPAD